MMSIDFPYVPAQDQGLPIALDFQRATMDSFPRSSCTFGAFGELGFNDLRSVTAFVEDAFTGWWYTTSPQKNMKVTWDDEIPN